METKACIVGAGAAGLMSAIFAAQSGAKTIVIEKNAAAGEKLLLTGGGRCNLTHTGTVEDFIRAYGKFGRFLRHSLYEFSPQATVEFFSDLGLATKTEENGVVFPTGERGSDVRDALLSQCQKLNVEFIFGRGIERIEKRDNGFAAFAGREILAAQKVIITTGGLSYPQTGSTGDGFKLAKSLGHTIVEPKAALAPLITVEKWTNEPAGTSLNSVKITAQVEDKKVCVKGPMIFTQDGIGGPAVLDLSRELADYLPAKKPIEIFIDMLPSMNETKLEEYLVDRLLQYSRKIIVNILFDVVPKKVAGFLCRLAGLAETPANQLKKEQRREIVWLLKKFPLSISAARPIDEAIITRGGVAANEIDPKMMQSKICPGLFFAGEVIDVDGPCGGYNLQICWSTGALAGKSAVK
ncbi:MAG: NAD(P)/FAD-dependent oxidoreductase [Sedimentisphaerales bacterium]|nr:NAD(P)/FAD-dependent oxidoreductase [Sedimentisphaerales bacterium]